MLNLSILLEDSARTFGSRTAVVLGDTRLTYAQVNAAANQVADLLVSRGIEGDIVPTCRELGVSFFRHLRDRLRVPGPGPIPPLPDLGRPAAATAPA